MAIWTKIDGATLSADLKSVEIKAETLGSFAVKKAGAGPTPVRGLPIGGRIFYDDGDNSATYTFYDASGNVIAYNGTNPETVLENAVSYEVSGTPTQDRFYVFNNELVTSKQWGKSGTSIGITYGGIGFGKSNTQTALQQSGWEEDSIFQYIMDSNTNKLNGCNDWYIGSKAEQDKLRAVESTVGIDWYSSYYIWSSVEYSDTKVYSWPYYDTTWAAVLKKYTYLGIYGCFAQRSF